jgi:multidrug efflux system membrane fusion protein
VLFTEGQHVKKGDVLAKIDPRLFQAALDQAKAKRAQDAATLVAAEKDMSRANTLALKSVETQQNVDQQRARVDQLKASIAADEAAIETAQTQLDYASIVAPSDGRHRHSPGRSGQYGARIGRKADRQPGAHTALRRRLYFARDRSHAVARVAQARPGRGDRLRPGPRQDALTVPTAAIQNGADGLFTWVVTPNNTAEPRTIEVGPAADDVTIITAGLTDGDRVVIAGQYKLQPKAPVVAALAPLASPARPSP